MSFFRITIQTGKSEEMDDVEPTDVDSEHDDNTVPTVESDHNSDTEEDTASRLTARPSTFTV